MGKVSEAPAPACTLSMRGDHDAGNDEDAYLLEGLVVGLIVRHFLWKSGGGDVWRMAVEDKSCTDKLPISQILDSARFKLRR